MLAFPFFRRVAGSSRAEPPPTPVDITDIADFPFRHPGYCPCCASSTVFVATNGWLRDNYFCQSCHSIPRERALALVLRKLRPTLADLTIHESSPVMRGMSKYLADRCPGYVASQFFPGAAPGAMVGDTRNENLEALSFADASVDVHVTQDVMEHVFDIQAINSEIARTLKPGGLHVMTLPVHPIARSVTRARRGADGTVEHLLDPVYHGNPVSSDGALVVTDFGDDVASLLAHPGLSVTRWMITDMTRGIAGEFLDVLVQQKHHAVPAA